MAPSPSSLYFLILLTVLIRTYPSHAQICYHSAGNFTSNSAYAKNRDAVLRSLPSNVSAHDGFYTTTAGENPDLSYASTYCRGDTSADKCAACVRSSVEDLIRKCPNQKAAFSWGTGDPPCFIRYSNSPIYGILQTDPTIQVKNGQNITMNQDQFDAIWRSLTQTLANQAGEGSSNLKFAKGQADLPDSKTIYSLLQCSPDISPTDCGEYNSIDDYYKCCRGSKGGLIYKSSCIFRWDLFQFWELSSSPQSSPPPHCGNVAKGTLAAFTASVAIHVMLLFVGYCYPRSRRAEKKYEVVQEENGVSGITSLRSLQFNWDNLHAATNNFSQENKLGAGGFGEVYQGRLLNGQEIAVKRLSRSSRQGVEELKNEIVLLAKLQHRNLVRLLGFCLEGGEKLLIYEFVPNKSLDYFMFDSIKCALLSWERRFSIIRGIARGLLYLHEDSCLRIIHRDLKPSNVLLDDNMNPKISDFGTARLFVLDQSRDKTAHITGTFGYMAPEYVRHREISVKTDVYSFGVVVLEIISGKKSSYFSNSGNSEHLLNYENATRRPTMASVVLMLENQSTTLAMPTRPTYLTNASVKEMWTSSNNGSLPPSTNEAQDGSTYYMVSLTTDQS